MAVTEQRVNVEGRANSLARKISLAILAGAPGPLVAWLAFRARFQGLIFADAMDYAQIARHLTQGQGFATSYLRPLSVGFTGHAQSQPDLFHAPLHAVVTALFFGAMGAKDSVAAFVTILFFLATIPLVYTLATRMFSRKVAVVAAILYVTSDRLVGSAISGLPIPLHTFLATLLLLVLFGKPNPSREEAPTPRPARALWAGALVALCYLTEYSSLLYLIPVGLYLFVTGGRARKAQPLLMLAGFLLVGAPWLIRNLRLTGDPFFGLSRFEVMTQTLIFPGYSFYRMTSAASQSPIGFFFTHLPQMARKLLGVSTTLYSQLPLLPGVFLLPFFVIGMFHSFGRDAGRLRWVLYGLTVVAGIATSLMHGALEVFVPLLPILMIFSAAFLLHLLERSGIHRFYQSVMAGFFVLLIAYPLLVTLAFGGAIPPNPLPPAMEQLDTAISAVPRKQIIVSDVPWAIAWYANRTAVWLPQSTTDYRRIDEKMEPMNLIFLSSMIGTYPAEEGIDSWKQMYYRGTAPTGFKLARAFPGPMLLFAREQLLKPEPKPR